MNMNTTQSFFLSDGEVTIKLGLDGVARVAAREGATYRVSVSEAPGEAGLAKNVVVLRDGDDLVLHYPDGLSVVISDYFVVCENGECSVVLPAQVDPNDADEFGKSECSVIDADRTLILASGDPTTVMDIVQSDAGLRAVVNEACIVPSDSSSGGWYWWLVPSAGAVAGLGSSGASRAGVVALSSAVGLLDGLLEEEQGESLDVEAPVAPTVTTNTDENGLLTVSGTAEAGSEIEITLPDGTTVTGVAGPDGSYSVGPITNPQPAGEIAITATDASFTVGGTPGPGGYTRYQISFNGGPFGDSATSYNLGGVGNAAVGDYAVLVAHFDIAGNQKSTTINFTIVDTASLPPVVLDLEDDRLEYSTAGVLFDADNDGSKEQTDAWVAADDGFLAYDKDDDGLITDTDELSFVSYLEGAKTDLEGLKAFDTNDNGLLDAGDAEFDKFLVWQDLNQDGISDEGELLGLIEAGIESITLESDQVSSEPQEGVIEHGQGTYTRTDGTTGTIGDVSFEYHEYYNNSVL